MCITDDTNILVLLLHYPRRTPFNLYLEASSSNATCPEWNIFELYNILGAPITSSLLFVHAFLGCDTVRSIFNKGKTILFSKLLQISNFIEYFYEENAVTSQIADMSEKVMLVLYGNKDYQTLDNNIKKCCTGKSSSHNLPQPPTMQQYNTPTGYIIRQFGQEMKKTLFQCGMVFKVWKIVASNNSTASRSREYFKFLKVCMYDCLYM